MVKPHSYSISDKNAKFLKSLAKMKDRSVSNTLDRILDKIRTGSWDKAIYSGRLATESVPCPHGSIDPKNNMCRDCYQIIN